MFSETRKYKQTIYRLELLDTDCNVYFKVGDERKTKQALTPKKVVNELKKRRTTFDDRGGQ